MYNLIPGVGTVVVGPTVPAMTREYAKLHIKSISDAEDGLVDTWILAATQLFEQETDRQVMQSTLGYWLDAFPRTRGRIELPRPPLVSVSSVQYINADGTATEFGDLTVSPPDLFYKVEAPAGPLAERGWVEPVFGQEWPTARAESASVKVTYLAGYGNAPGSVPPLILGALCYMIGLFDRYREMVSSEGNNLVEVPGVRMILNGFKYSAKSSVTHRSSPVLTVATLP